MGGVDVTGTSGNNGVVNGLQERSGVVDQGSMDSVVESSRVEQGGVSLGLTLGDVGHNGGGLEAGEDLAQDRSGQRGVVDQRSLDSRVVDQGSMETRGVDNGSLDRSIVDHRGLERSIVDQGSL